MYVYNSCLHLDTETGKHEYGKEEDENAKQQLLPAEQHIVDDSAHLGDEADGSQGTQGADAEEHDEVGREVGEGEGLADGGPADGGVEDEDGRGRDDDRPVHHVPHTADGCVGVQEKPVCQYLNTVEDIPFEIDSDICKITFTLINLPGKLHTLLACCINRSYQQQTKPCVEIH